MFEIKLNGPNVNIQYSAQLQLYLNANVSFFFFGYVKENKGAPSATSKFVITYKRGYAFFMIDVRLMLNFKYVHWAQR